MKRDDLLPVSRYLSPLADSYRAVLADMAATEPDALKVAALTWLLNDHADLDALRNEIADKGLAPAPALCGGTESDYE